MNPEQFLILVPYLLSKIFSLEFIESNFLILILLWNQVDR
jgi:hypothetical protein